MPPTIASRLCRLAPFALTCLALAGLPSVAVASPCASAQADLGATPAWQVRDETLSLLNEERSSRGRGALELDDRLTLAARAHSCDMVTERYFAHDSLSGRFLSGRIAATGWMDGRSGWRVGENLAWGTGSLASPRATVDAWMQCAGHRRNILQRRFQVIGIGLMGGTPIAGPGDGITYTTDFGS